MNQSGQVTLLAVLLAGPALAQNCPPPAAWLENLAYTVSATTTWVDNISRTSYAPTRQNAAIFELSLDANQHRQLAPSWLMSLGAEATYLAEPEYDLANNFKIGPRVALQYKFGLGPLAPVLQFDTALSYKSARLHADRGWTADAGLRLAKRLNSTLQVAASGQWLEHYASSATFDLQQRTLAVEANWDINERWRLSGTASRLSGRVVANAAWSVWGRAIGGGFGPTVSNYYSSIPWEVTELYGPGWVSYNVEAHADLWTLALACALSERTTLELRAGGAYVINKIDIRYPTESWGLSLTHRF
jgi:hypothetical protein